MGDDCRAPMVDRGIERVVEGLSDVCVGHDMSDGKVTSSLVLMLLDEGNFVIPTLASLLCEPRCTSNVHCSIAGMYR